MDTRVRQAHDVIDEAMARYHTDQVYAAFSGGHDSLTAAHITSRHAAFRGAVHLDTTIGVPQTRAFVEQTCARHGWPLHVAQPAKIWGYVQIVLRFGFPGPVQHPLLYRSLKQRPLSALLSTLRDRPGQNIILCTGMRRQESARRMRLVDHVRKEGNIIWLSPLWDWTALDCTAYISEEHLARNPVKDRLHISGECLCGCFADRHEREEIRLWFPQVEAHLGRIESLLQHVQTLGLADYGYTPEQMVWGWGSGNYEAQQQAQLQLPLPLCYYCHAGRSEKTDGALLRLP